MYVLKNKIYVHQFIVNLLFNQHKIFGSTYECNMVGTYCNFQFLKECYN